MPYELHAEMFLPLPPEEVFRFFGNAHNLEAITPSSLRFEVLTPAPIDMKPGTLIDYRIKLHGIPIRWRTRITEWDPPHKFVDEQLKGPYRLWVHTHTFTPKDGGTVIGDHVLYSHWGGPIMERFFVRPDLDRIFAYRKVTIEKLLLGKRTSDDAPQK